MQGIVMETRGTKAVVLCKDGTFKEIYKRNCDVGQKINIASRAYVRYIAVAACLILFAFTGFGGYKMYYTPTSYIYVDINPSIRIDVNRFDSVIAVVPLNDDAKELLEECPIKERKADGCIKKIVEACREKKYLNDENNDVEIDVVSGKQELVEKVNSVSKEIKEKDGKIIVAVSEASESDNHSAMSMNVSLKRLRAIEEYTVVNGGNVRENAENLKNVPTKEIRTMSEMHKNEKEGKRADTEKNTAVGANEGAQNSGENKATNKGKNEINDTENAEGMSSYKNSNPSENTEKAENTEVKPSRKDEDNNASVYSDNEAEKKEPQHTQKTNDADDDSDSEKKSTHSVPKENDNNDNDSDSGKKSTYSVPRANDDNDNDSGSKKKNAQSSENNNGKTENASSAGNSGKNK